MGVALKRVLARRNRLQYMPADHRVLGAIARLQRQGAADITEFVISQEIEQATGKRIGYGTLYRALSRLEGRGALIGRWEHPEKADTVPQRKFYSLAQGG